MGSTTETRKKATTKASRLTNEITESVNEHLVKFELIKESTTKVLSELKPLEAQWNKNTKMWEEMIKKINNFDQENYKNLIINA